MSHVQQCDQLLNVISCLMWSGDEPSRNLTWLLSLASYLRGSSLIWLSHISHSPASLGDPIVTNLIACGLPPSSFALFSAGRVRNKTMDSSTLKDALLKWKMFNKSGIVIKVLKNIKVVFCRHTGWLICVIYTFPLSISLSILYYGIEVYKFIQT